MVEEVLPELRRKCAKRFVTFTEVDPRWAIAEEQANESAGRRRTSRRDAGTQGESDERSRQQIHGDFRAALQLGIIRDKTVATIFDGGRQMDRIRRLEAVRGAQRRRPITHRTR